MKKYYLNKKGENNKEHNVTKEYRTLRKKKNKISRNSRKINRDL